MLSAILSLAVMIIAIYILSLMTESFFIPSLDKISLLLRLPSSVAGASLMAMGSSAPELAIALIALFRGSGEYSDVGIGTIVGSAVFNILIITGVSAISRPAKITLKVAIRDCAFYILCIFLLLYVFWDGYIIFWEALIFLAFYAIYLIVLFQWNRYVKEDILENPAEPLSEVEVEKQLVSRPAADLKNMFDPLNKLLEKGLGFFTGSVETAFVRVFVVSVLFIALLSWVLVEGVIIFAEAVHIPAVIVALTLLAAGTSAPDMMSSILVAKQGRGDMAVANAVGSNVFDILIGLGLPWMIVILLGADFVQVNTEGLRASTFVLLATVFILFFFLYTKRKLSRWEGYVLVSVYLIYVIWIWLGS